MRALYISLQDTPRYDLFQSLDKRDDVLDLLLAQRVLVGCWHDGRETLVDFDCRG